MTSEEIFTIADKLTKEHRAELLSLAQKILARARAQIPEFITSDGKPTGDWHLLCMTINALMDSDLRTDLMMTKVHMEHQEANDPGYN